MQHFQTWFGIIVSMMMTSKTMTTSHACTFLLLLLLLIYILVKAMDSKIFRKWNIGANLSRDKRELCRILRNNLRAGFADR